MNIFKAIAEKFSIPLPWGIFKNSAFTNYALDYQTFLQDLEHCEHEIIIESPYITSQRMKTFDRFFEKLIAKGIKVYIFTRDPNEHEETMKLQAEKMASGAATPAPAVKAPAAKA